VYVGVDRGASVCAKPLHFAADRRLIHERNACCISDLCSAAPTAKTLLAALNCGIQRKGCDGNLLLHWAPATKLAFDLASGPVSGAERRRVGGSLVKAGDALWIAQLTQGTPSGLLSLHRGRPLDCTACAGNALWIAHLAQGTPSGLHSLHRGCPLDCAACTGDALWNAQRVQGAPSGLLSLHRGRPLDCSACVPTS